MVKRAESVSRRRERRDTYIYQTQRPLICLIFVLPPLAIFQFSATYYGTDLLVPRYIESALRHLGATGAYLSTLPVLVILIAQHVVRRDPLKVPPRVLAGMVGESILATVPLIALSVLSSRLSAEQMAVATAPVTPSVFQQVVKSIGAGIYEEFLFRLVLMGLVLLVLVDVFGARKDVSAAVAAVIAAVTFSLCHFSSEQIFGPSAFDWGRFVFLTTAGVFWSAIYLFRGYGIAAWSHILWDVYVVFSRL